MDIGNISGMYSDVLSTKNQSTTKLENKLNTDLTQAADDELMEACEQFEAYFVEQMFKSMMKTVPKNEDMSAATSTLTDYYKDEMLRELATDSTETNSLGLAQTLYEQMKRNYEL
ncbi:MAG: rod-binding protein [Lachnospiraceae bacterium]|nr:rod-binding protein [Lachnospiraceae bacterium]